MLQRNPIPSIDSTALRSIRCSVRRAIKSGGSFKRHEEDDLVQECCIWLTERIDNYDHTRAKWSTYCRVIADGYLANRKRRKREVPTTSLHETHQNARGQDYLPEQTATPADSHHNCGKRVRPDTQWLEMNDDLNQLIERLPPKLRELCLTYLKAPSSTEVAAKLDISRTTVNRRFKAIRVILSGLDMEQYRA